jgi:hypothetical protein
MSELRRWVVDAVASMDKGDRENVGAEFARLCASVGVDLRRGPRRAVRPVAGDDAVDPALARHVDEAGLPAPVAHAVKRLLAGAPLSDAAAPLGVTKQALHARAKKVLGESAAVVVDRARVRRALALRERVARLTNSERVRLSPRALAC